MLLLTLNVIYVLLALGMIAMILMQRGSGAQAGAGFGGGASATVFGSRGASSFLTKSTKWMGIMFFAISLFMAWNATREAAPGPTQQDLGIMAQEGPAAPAPASGNATIPVAPATQQPVVPPSTVPSAPAPAQSSATAPAPGQAPPAPEPSGSGG